MSVTPLAADVAGQLSRAALTYREIGGTAGLLPRGYRHLDRSVVIGSGTELFTAAALSLLSWQVHLRAGVQVSPSSPRVEQGGVVVLRRRTGPIKVDAPCRVVYVVDGPDRRGFAYGTLPGHPECGEEAFLIDHFDDDTVRFRIVAFSRPATRLAKAAGPFGTLLQRRVTSQYLGALTD